MFILLSRNKNTNYDTDLALYSKIDSFISLENLNSNRSVQWKRGYQGLWIELRRFKKLGKSKRRGKPNAKKKSTKVFAKIDKNDELTDSN